MTRHPARRRMISPRPIRARCRSAFSLVELLTVIFIISLLIAVLIPSLNAARNASKKTKTAADIRALGTALNLFKNDNERKFPQTNGYPPSFAHPRIGSYAFQPHLGQFPFLRDSSPPIVYGAQWLPAMLMGIDQQGYVKSSSVPPGLKNEPFEWYTQTAVNSSDPLPRAPHYIEPGGVKTVETSKLRGRPPTSSAATAMLDDLDAKKLPVFVDAFDQPILYYAANKHGRTTNMAAVARNEENIYPGTASSQEQGPAYYFHQDNVVFTGSSISESDRGWDFGGGAHAMAEPGESRNANDILTGDEPVDETFARFILDRTIARAILSADDQGDDVPPTDPLRPVNSDSYMLISPGVDGRYGTSDDVTNFTLSLE